MNSVDAPERTHHKAKLLTSLVSSLGAKQMGGWGLCLQSNSSHRP